MAFKLLSTLVAIVACYQSILPTQCSDHTLGLAQLQDPQMRLSLKSFEIILNVLRETSQDASVIAAEGKQVSVGNLVKLAQINLNKCTEDHFRLLVDLRKNFNQTPLATYIKNIISQQRRFCEQYLDEQADLKVAGFSVLTRRNFELILKYDKIGHDFYVSPEVSIVKLRQILELTSNEKDQQQQQQKQTVDISSGQYLVSCREITSQLNGLVPIRRDHDIFARLPMSCDRYFRAYEFCRNLVDFNYSSELAKMLFLDVNARTELTRFNVHLDRANNKVSGREHVIEAARAYVRERLPSSRRQTVGALASASQHAARTLNRLRAACTSSLDLTENLLWLREHTITKLQADSPHLTGRAIEYLRALDGCKHLIVDVQVKDILTLPNDTQTTTGRPAGGTNELEAGMRPSRKNLQTRMKKFFNFGNLN